MYSENYMQVRKQQLELDMEQQTGLDSMLKSRDITLLMKVCLLKAMVFLVGMYECESWIIKKSEH